MAEQASCHRALRPLARKHIYVGLLNLLVSIHVVWFYLSRVPSWLQLGRFEHGEEHTPFQYRLLMMVPLGWAHRSATLGCLATELSLQRAWFPTGVSAEGIVEAAIDLLSVLTAGLVARALYVRSSPTRLLASCIYPLTMLLILSTYALLTIHVYRFVYDIPSLAFFSLGLLCIYTRTHPAWFAAVFLAGTINRETTLLLLVFFLLAQCGRGGRLVWRALYRRSTLVTVIPLAASWTLWHIWIVHRFAANPSAAGPRLWLNLGTLLIPLAWPQLASTIGFPMLLVFFLRRHIRDPVLRAWAWGLPIWLACMLHFGLLIESRVFGELIPYLACAVALIAEEKVLVFAARKDVSLARV